MEGGATAEKGKSKEGKGEPNSQQVQQLAFSIFDADGDGLISLTELENVLKSVGNSPQTPLQMLHKIIDHIDFMLLMLFLFICYFSVIFHPQARRSTGKT
jgi:Ca2+-binding EF-hand superfamily protein